MWIIILCVLSFNIISLFSFDKLETYKKSKQAIQIGLG